MTYDEETTARGAYIVQYVYPCGRANEERLEWLSNDTGHVHLSDALRAAEALASSLRATPGNKSTAIRVIQEKRVVTRTVIKEVEI